MPSHWRILAMRLPMGQPYSPSAASPISNASVVVTRARRRAAPHSPIRVAALDEVNRHPGECRPSPGTHRWRGDGASSRRRSARRRTGSPRRLRRLHASTAPIATRHCWTAKVDALQEGPQMAFLIGSEAAKFPLACARGVRCDLLPAGSSATVFTGVAVRFS
jgi:hypothetical protein